MTLTGSIESAEHQYKKILEEFFISEYGDRNISSHGLGHHRRVWGYAKKLISILNESGYIDDNCIPFKLIIACYLHDIGMSIDPGVNHGFHSKVLCNRFLVKNNLPENDYRDVLQAVHNHDNKEYKDSLTSFDLLTILSVADDLDAFGFTGIYRYSEIYLIRGISHRDIGKLILANATGRFENFKRHFGFSKVLLEEQEKKFKILHDFFLEYNKLTTEYKPVNQQPAGYYGVIDIILDVVQKKADLRNICNNPEIYSNDPIILWFYKGLAAELKAGGETF